MAKLSKPQVMEKARAAGIDVNDAWTVKEMYAALEEIDKQHDIQAVVVTPVKVFPSQGVRRLPSVMRLPHRGLRQVKAQYPARAQRVRVFPGSNPSTTLS